MACVQQALFGTALSTVMTAVVRRTSRKSTPPPRKQLLSEVEPLVVQCPLPRRRCYLAATGLQCFLVPLLHSAPNDQCTRRQLMTSHTICSVGLLLQECPA